MRESAVKTVAKKKISVDDQLAEHLKQAEYHLIEAIKLFYGPRPPIRVSHYQKRLERAQELVTGLYREELVRMRGPLLKVVRK